MIDQKWKNKIEYGIYYIQKIWQKLQLLLLLSYSIS